jgi:hypothetical protein
MLPLLIKQVFLTRPIVPSVCTMGNIYLHEIWYNHILLCLTTQRFRRLNTKNVGVCVMPPVFTSVTEVTNDTKHYILEGTDISERN